MPAVWIWPLLAVGASALAGFSFGVESRKVAVAGAVAAVTLYVVTKK